MTKRQHTQAFTLVELSIVLVIIGLITGGVLVGNTLIEAARIRGTAAQMTQLNTAMHTFQAKYDALPGDMTATQAAPYNFFQGPGDGDGLLDIQGKQYTFLRHLSEAQMIPGQFGMTGPCALLDSTAGAGWGFPACAYNASSGTPWTDPSSFEPLSKLGNGNYIVPSRLTGAGGIKNYGGGAPGVYTVAAFNRFWTTNSSWSFTVTPKQLKALDLKMDDGVPFTGNWQSVGQTNTWVADCTVGYCNCMGTSTSDPVAIYNIGYGFDNKSACLFRVVMQ